MKTYLTLIKLVKARTDEMRKSLQQLQAAHDRLSQTLTRLQNELAAEQELAMRSEETRFAYSNYAKVNMERQQQVQEGLGKLERDIAEVMENLRTLFSEQKTYEIALEQKKAAIAKEQQRQEDIRLGEIALNSFMRKDEK